MISDIVATSPHILKAKKEKRVSGNMISDIVATSPYILKAKKEKRVSSIYSEGEKGKKSFIHIF